MPKTGFLDLAAELRLMVYDQILPADRTVHFPPTIDRWKEEQTFIAACAAHPQLKEELREFVFTECSAYIKVMPHRRIALPPAIEWHRFKHITIEIQHYEDHSGLERWGGMKELVESLSYGEPESLPDIKVIFYEDDFNNYPSGRDYMWTEEISRHMTYRWHGTNSKHCSNHSACYSGYRDPLEEAMAAMGIQMAHRIEPWHTWLRNTRDEYSNPIVIEILDHFLGLSPCKSCTVSPPYGLAFRASYLPRHDPERRIFDRMYAADLCAALELWVGGERDGVELPAGISRHGEPRLEQLAYQKREGRWYCDDGRDQEGTGLSASDPIFML